MEDKEITSFKEKLNSQHTWPGVYIFKFIVPNDRKEEVERLFEGDEITIKNSSKGNYASITVNKVMQNADDVIAVYIEAKKIEGIISL